MILTTSVSFRKFSPGAASKASYVTFAGETVPVKLSARVQRPKLVLRHHPAAIPNPAPAPEQSLRQLAAIIGPILRGDAVLYSGIHDIKVALPQTAPLPQIRRSDIPYGFQGDVVVDIVIDKTGKVVRATIAESFAHLDGKVIATVMNWRFAPATYDGVPVASIQEIHFHYPDNALPDYPS